MKTISANKMTSAGCKVKIWVADWFAQQCNKMGGDLKKSQTIGRNLIEIWKAVGMDLNGVEFIWSSEEINSSASEYWPLVMDIARSTNLPIIMREISLNQKGGPIAVGYCDMQICFRVFSKGKKRCQRVMHHLPSSWTMWSLK
ncbi:hypothetical protein Ddye_022258 [Dipteronia dyeriana]|uniref:tyrosine--tRNA ligase n=1 Tax=Dipteronia dyeriana TaxID=168575 RepID=A0AAD9U3Y2_9ROSI|nr:hypothetical protein Ddye_022258 [Dipteronia dyeriana]